MEEKAGLLPDFLLFLHKKLALIEIHFFAPKTRTRWRQKLEKRLQTQQHKTRNIFFSKNSFLVSWLFSLLASEALLFLTTKWGRRSSGKRGVLKSFLIENRPLGGNFLFWDSFDLFLAKWSRSKSSSSYSSHWISPFPLGEPLFVFQYANLEEKKNHQTLQMNVVQLHFQSSKKSQSYKSKAENKKNSSKQLSHTVFSSYIHQLAFRIKP